MHYSLALSSILAVVGAVPIADPITIFNRAPSPGTVYTRCSTPNTLALAYDDGPYQYTQSIVNKLNQAGAKGTFFFTGTLYGCIYNQAAAVKSAYEGGHQVASHTWTHGHVGSMSSSQLTTEMTKLEQAYVNIFGKKPRYMRPPYLETSGSVTSVMRTLGYNIITNDIDTGDWNGQSAAQSQAKFTQAGASGNGHIPLMHETYSSTANELTTWLINWAKTNNLKIITVVKRHRLLIMAQLSVWEMPVIGVVPTVPSSNFSRCLQVKNLAGDAAGDPWSKPELRDTILMLAFSMKYLGHLLQSWIKN